MKGKNKLEKTVRNIGFLGYGKHITSRKNKAYILWTQIFSRCYSENTHLNRPSYIGCSVDERWHNFQVFGEWFELNYINGYHLDKDILVKGNKIYGPDTCCFVPQKINSLFLNRKAKRGELPIGIRKRISKNNIIYIAQITKNNIHYFWDCFETIEKAFEKYKFEKEKYIKEVAEINKNNITTILYQALINYKVEITD
jgi:hypothetical protein